MAFIEKVARDLASEIVKSRKYNYSYEALDNFLYSNPQITCSQFSLKNKRGQTLSAMLIKKCISNTCIIYAHGLGSNKLEVLPIAHHFKDFPYNICSFDFSGSGRSQGQNTTYGLLEQDDINAVLKWLDSTRQYEKYILWGRSMGGASIILSQAKIINEKVQCIVLDSPFSSFERVAIELASKASFVPTVLLSLLIDPLKKQFEHSNNAMNPFKVDASVAVSSIDTKFIMIYSKNDRIVSYEHSKELAQKCKKNPVEIEIAEDHNKPRKKDTYLKVKEFMEDCMRDHERKTRRSRSRSRGISVTSKESTREAKYRKSICSSILTDKSCNSEMFSIGPLTETTPTSKKPAIIKSMILKNQQRKKYGIMGMSDKENLGASINYGGKFKKSILESLQ